MKTVPLIVLVWIIALSSYAQDTIYRTNGKIAAVTILNSDFRNISYKLAGDTASPVFTISKSYINKIVYHNGHTEKFESMAEVNTKIRPALIYDYQQDSLRNMIYFKASDIAFGIVALEYERFFKSGNFSVKIPLAFGIKTSNKEFYGGLSYYRNNLFSAGVGFYFYPLPLDRFRFFGGISAYYGQNRDFRYVDSYNPSYRYSYTEQRFYSFLFEGGIVFQMEEHLALSMDAGIGSGSQMYNYASTSGYNSETRNSKEPMFDLRGTLKIGFKF